MTEDERHGRRIHKPVAALAALLVLVGVIALAVAIGAQRQAPQPPASAAISYSASAGVPSVAATPSAATPSAAASSAAASPSATSSLPAASQAKVVGPVLKAAAPIRIDIPEIGVTSTLLQLGLNPDHSVQVPPLEKDSKAGWYQNSPTPGQLGPSVILGHVDSAEYGPGVFFRLGALRPGNQLTVTRADNTVAVFRVDKVVSYPKDHFPTFEVYGNTNHAALRLITCGGRFDLSTHDYESNIVAYASMISSHSA
ncbi:MAG: class sortase [Frankiales bacterium]|nr:class sortase [Frankiales bacterium]